MLSRSIDQLTLSALAERGSDGRCGRLPGLQLRLNRSSAGAREGPRPDLGPDAAGPNRGGEDQADAKGQYRRANPISRERKG